MTINRPVGALEGVRIIDLTTVLMGPLATRMLADHGADVIRVEDPGSEAYAADQRLNGVSAIALNTQRNKRRVGLDLKSVAGLEAMQDLIGTADVVVSNLRAGALERLGLDPDSLLAANPTLIYCIANGYGAEGPYADRAAYDDAIQALSGLAALHGRVTGEPRFVPSAIVDKIMSLNIVQAVMAALLHRHQTGNGQAIRVPMFETMVAFNMVEHLRGAAFDPPRGEVGYPRVLSPNRRPYECADGWICLLPYNTNQWRSFFALVGRPELIKDEMFASHDARVRNADDLYGFVAEVAPMFSIDEWMSRCDEHSIPCNPVLDLADLLHDPHIEAVGLIESHEHPDEGPYISISDPIAYGEMSTALRRHAARPGEHTAEVMAEIGWTAEQIATLQ